MSEELYQKGVGFVASDISVNDWLEAEKSLGFVQPPESVTVRQYAAIRHFKDNATGHQKAYRILQNLVAHKRAVKLQTRPVCYRLRAMLPNTGLPANPHT